MAPGRGENRNFARRYLRTGLESPLLLQNDTFDLLVFLARQSAAQNRTAKTAPAAPSNLARTGEIAQLLAWCEAHLDEPLEVRQLAAKLFLSPRHFTELFTREVGQSPAAYLRRLRLERAREMLRENHLSATQIALQTGFGDAAHFSRAFKKLYGVSPRAFRHQRNAP